MMVESEVCTAEVLSAPVEQVNQSVDIVVEADQVVSREFEILTFSNL
jgi:hypothetical protein